MKTMTLRKLCRACLGLYEQLPETEQAYFDRVWTRTMMIVRLTTDNLVTPTKDCRARLEDLYWALGRYEALGSVIERYHGHAVQS